MSKDGPTDQHLLTRLRQGDHHAYEILHDRYRPALVRYARRLLGPGRDVAEDVVQEALMRAHPALVAVDREIVVGAWLYRIVKNLCLDELRRPKFVVPTEGFEDRRRSADVHDEAALRERLWEVVGDVKALPAPERTALLHLVSGTPHEESARLAGTTVGAAKSRVYRARTRLARAQVRRELVAA